MLKFILCLILVVNPIINDSKANELEEILMSPYEKYMRSIFKRESFFHDDDQINSLNNTYKKKRSFKSEELEASNDDLEKRAKFLRKFFINRKLNDF